VFLGSADWMPRNFFRRIETVFPVLDGNLRERLIAEILALSLADNVRARQLQSNGTYQRATPGRREASRRSQFEFIERAQRHEPDIPARAPSHNGFPRVKVVRRPVSP